MMNDSITAELFAALNILVLEQLDDSTFALIGHLPNWFLQFYPEAESTLENIRLEIKFPFLENFIVDAETYWQGNPIKPLKSGFWCEVDSSGNEIHFEASAVLLRNQKILLIEVLNRVYEEQQSIIQTARENRLNYETLVREAEKKEILLHCIVHDLAGQLTAIFTSFDLLEYENLTPKGRKRLENGRRQSTKQKMLIREILNAFSSEVKSLEAFTDDPAEAPDALLCVKEVVESLEPTFSQNKMQLQLEPNIDLSKDWKVVGEKTRLERVLSNLVENAFRHSSADSTVTITLKEDEKFIMISVDDEGSGVPQELAKNLFQKFSQGKEKSGRIGLGLYFCRITVERWGGTIGYSSRPEGGSRFWLRLLRPVK